MLELRTDLVSVGIPLVYQALGGSILKASVGSFEGVEAVRTAEAVEMVYPEVPGLAGQGALPAVTVRVPDAYVYRIDAAVVGEKLRVLSSGGAALGRFKLASCGVHPSSSILAAFRQGGSVSRQEKNIILPWAHSWMSYGDFISHVLPALCRILSRMSPSERRESVIALNGFGRKPFLKNFLELLGFSSEQLVDLEVETLDVTSTGRIFTASPFRYTAYSSHPKDFDLVLAELKQYMDPRSRSEKLYLTRSGARRYLQESELMPLLKEHNYQIVDAGKLSAREQIRLFSQASRILGPHGAAFASSLFADNVKLLELQDPAWAYPCFRFISHHRGFDYRCLSAFRAERFTRPMQAYRTADLDIPAATVEVGLEWLES
jgi:hypothetical protein